jgi:hypothetical protein
MELVMDSSAVWLGILGVLGAVSGCSSWPDATARDPAADGRHAADEVAAARCDRQSPACESKTGTHYATRDACLEAKAAASVKEAGLKDCSYHSLNERLLRRCIAEIRQGKCGTGIAQLPECQGEKLCPYEPEEGTARMEPVEPSQAVGLASSHSTHE